MKQEFRKNDNRKNFKKDPNKNFKNEKQLEENEYDDIVEGRNAVLELLDSDRDINKIFVQSGERHGSINKIIAIAKENKVVVAEVEKSKLDFMSKTKNHQGVIAVVPPFNYCEVEDILEYAKSKNVQLELIPIGKEAFIFIVNNNNLIDNLSVDQIKDIYTGKISNWKQVGGENTPIIALQRVEGSGSQTAMLSFMNGTQMKAPKQTFMGRKIGYSFRYYVESIVNDGNLKMLSLNGAEPSIENIRNNVYPIVDNFYMVYRKDNTNENIDIIKDFVLSEKGQKIIEDTGYVSVIDY